MRKRQLESLSEKYFSCHTLLCIALNHYFLKTIWTILSNAKNSNETYVLCNFLNTAGLMSPCVIIIKQNAYVNPLEHDPAKVRSCLIDFKERMLTNV